MTEPLYTSPTPAPYEQITIPMSDGVILTARKPRR
jgi:hypothetical protein